MSCFFFLLLISFGFVLLSLYLARRCLNLGAFGVRVDSAYLSKKLFFNRICVEIVVLFRLWLWATCHLNDFKSNVTLSISHATSCLRVHFASNKNDSFDGIFIHLCIFGYWVLLFYFFYLDNLLGDILLSVFFSLSFS